jgi:hypothetical protein
MIGMDSTTRVAAETRKAMMAVATVTWEGEDETVRTARARIEDTSPSGACFRLKVPIKSGTRVEVSWCRDDFSGMSKWCREEDGEYVVGPDCKQAIKYDRGQGARARCAGDRSSPGTASGYTKSAYSGRAPCE